jgi:hypothetical protein
MLWNDGSKAPRIRILCLRTKCKWPGSIADRTLYCWRKSPRRYSRSDDSYCERLPLVRSITYYLLIQISSLTRWTDTHGVKFVTFRSTFNYALSMNYKFSIRTVWTNRCTTYFQFISIINLYMFRASLLLFIRRCYSVYTIYIVKQLVYVMRLYWLALGNSQSP